MTQLNLGVEFEFRIVHHSIFSLLRSFADWTNRTRLPCLHSLSNSVCQGPVCSSYNYGVFHVFPGACNLSRCLGHIWHVPSRLRSHGVQMGSLSIDVEDTEAKTTMPTTSSEIRYFAVWMSMCLSLCVCQTSSPFTSSFGRAEVHGSPCTSFLVSTEVFFPEDCPFWLSAWYPLWSVNVSRKKHEKHMETIAALHIRCEYILPCKFEIQFKSCRVIIVNSNNSNSNSISISNSNSNNNSSNNNKKNNNKLQWWCFLPGSHHVSRVHFLLTKLDKANVCLLEYVEMWT